MKFRPDITAILIRINTRSPVRYIIKPFKNQIDYKNGAILIANENSESQLVFGKGRAYGIELFCQEKVWEVYGLDQLYLISHRTQNRQHQ